MIYELLIYTLNLGEEKKKKKNYDHEYALIDDYKSYFFYY